MFPSIHTFHTQYPQPNAQFAQYISTLALNYIPVDIEISFAVYPYSIVFKLVK